MKRLPELDFLRGIAILLVLFTHFRVVDFLYHIGWVGVDLFFVLSGFLVSGLLFAEYKKYQKVQAFRFLVRRGFKIYPMFYLFILVSIIAGKSLQLASYDVQAEYFSGISRATVLHEILFIQNYFPGIWINTWSLGVEEHFYIGLLLLCLVIIKTGWIENRKSITTAIVILMLTALFLRILNNIQNPDFYYISHLFPTHLRMDSLLFGVMISYFWHFENDKFISFIQKRKFILSILSLVLISFSFFFSIKSFFMNTAGLSLLYLGFGISLSLLVALPGIGIEKITGKLIYKLIRQAGIYSYSIYIWHLFIKHYSLYFVHHYFPDIPNAVYFLIYFCLSVGAGVLMSKLIEQPMLKLRNRWFPGHSLKS